MNNLQVYIWQQLNSLGGGASLVHDCILYLALINREGGLYGRILTEVVSTDRTQ